MLIQLKAYLEARGRASLTEMALRLGSDEEAVRGMLAHWIAKGRVARLSCPPAACAKSCCGCPSAAAEVYEWRGTGAAG
ncbi:MAG: FeoC-like transcriptional regulator [Cereibacter changlensis]|uniref:FeoC-like transcriptional regulator n=1 Tax=Cereibacter changlensis TaxID=402884 RepID=UPI0030621A33